MSAAEAKALMEAGYTYVDVRTCLEYATGHPVGAVNVPLDLRVEGRLEPNVAFIDAMKRRFQLTDKLVVGCARGSRSRRAVDELVSAGYSELAELRAGFAGIRDPFGRTLETGWMQSGYPTELTTAGGDYVPKD